MFFDLFELHLQLDERSVNKLKAEIVKEATPLVYKELIILRPEIETFVKKIIKNRILVSPEAISLSDPNGKLRAELGVESSASDILNIIQFIIENIKLDIKKHQHGSSDINIELLIHMAQPIENIYSKSYSYYITEKDVKIEWLMWLLEAGNADVVFGYRTRYGVITSRTGSAIMIKSNKANWRVPPEFSGTIDNNFITRSFDGVELEIANYLESTIKL